MTIEKIKEIFNDVSDGIRVVFLVHRSKEGGLNNTHKRHLKKFITTNSKEFFEAISELKEIMDKDERTLRIYANLNSRDINKAIRLFKQRQLNSDYDPAERNQQFYLDIKNQFISCLMDKSARKTKNFLFDLDEIDDRGFHSIYNLIEKRTKILLHYPTKNGYHIITEPFNYYKELDNESLIQSVHTDGLMLIDFS